MDMILSALKHLNCADLDHNDWIRVGMALKNDGYDLSVWDEWSSHDPDRYHPGECEQRWKSFKGNKTPVTGGSIVKMAQDRGWINGVMAWDDVLTDDGDGYEPEPEQNGTEELTQYLQTLFEPDDRVGYVTNDAWQNKDGKWVPAKGVFDRTAGELIASLRRYPEDLEATVGTWKPEAGGWIRFNPLDGQGVRNENVTRFRFALVESDEMPISEQIALYRKLELPIAAMVHSGGKSVHAIVRVDAENAEEYRKRVNFLYDFLASHGVKVDTQNRNPSRLSRMPGVTRNGQRQKLLGMNIGRKSWADWMDYAEGISDELPGIHPLSDYAEKLPDLPEELIEGVLRRGHKMLISGSSKAGKSFLLMELCIAIAEGIEWLGFKCRKGRVLYVNLEIDPASCIHRFAEIRKAMNLAPVHSDDILIWNLRGHAVPLDQLVPKLVRRVRDMHLDAIIIDPIYKVITGDENSASDMAKFCNEFDKICTATGCSVIYCHHHAKGAQGAKRAMDRASGSGVFARDPDAQLDMIELEMTDHIKWWEAEQGATAWRMECSLREFPNFRPINFWFKYPIHRLDTGEDLEELPTQGSPEAGRLKNGRYKTARMAEAEFRDAYCVNNVEGSVAVPDLAKYMDVTDQTIYTRIRKMNGEFILHKGRVYHKDKPPKDDDPTEDQEKQEKPKKRGRPKKEKKPKEAP